MNPYLLVGLVVFGFGIGWSVNGAFKDQEIAEKVAVIQANKDAVQDEVDKTLAEQAVNRQLRDARKAESSALAATRAERDRLALIASRKKEIKYVTQDPNATDCGFSALGVLTYNHYAAGGSGMPETEGSGRVAYGPAIEASNAAVIAALGQSFTNHWIDIRRIQGLQDHIRDECLAQEGEYL